MTKKNKSRNAKPAAEQNPVAENEKKPITPKKLKPGSEIDDIFAGKKRKKPEKDAAAASEDSMRDPKRTVKKDSKVRKENGSVSIKKDSKVRKENGSVSGSRPRKRTGDGLAIFTEEELGIGKADAGGTPLCPFDCDCCF